MKKLVISATITPLLEDGSLDKAGLKKIFERNIAHGIDGIFILGSMGECHQVAQEQLHAQRQCYLQQYTQQNQRLLEHYEGSVLLGWHPDW